MKIGVIGLGLIGGSIFKDLLKLNYDVIAVSNSQNGEKIFKDYSVLKDCALVFVCSPMNKTLEILDKLESILPSETVVTDVCSLKSFVCKKRAGYVIVKKTRGGRFAPNCRKIAFGKAERMDHSGSSKAI